MRKSVGGITSATIREATTAVSCVSRKVVPDKGSLNRERRGYLETMTFG